MPEVSTFANDANGHALALGDIVHPDNTNEMILRIDAFDGTLASCRFKDATQGAVIPFKPEHLIWISTPTP